MSSSNRHQNREASFGVLFLASSVVETLFYLPNRFRQSIMLNTHNVAFTSSEGALLSLMSIIFNLQNKHTIDEFKLKQFYSCYRLFFSSTLIYESMAVALRMKLFDFTQSQYESNPYLTGFGVGAIVQQATLPLFKLNIANHNYSLGDKESVREFFAAVRKASRETKFEYLFKAPMALLFRGGVFGTLQLGLYKEVLEYVDRKSTSETSNQIHSQRVREFIGSVDDGNELLNRLALSGYFDQQLDSSRSFKGVNSYKAILISSGIVSLLLSMIITPLDLVVFNQLQTRLYSPIDSPALRKISAF